MLLRLPVVYAVAIALREAGVAAEAIARQIELPGESMGAVFAIAEAKLASLVSRGQSPR